MNAFIHPISAELIYLFNEGLFNEETGLDFTLSSIILIFLFPGYLVSGSFPDTNPWAGSSE